MQLAGDKKTSKEVWWTSLILSHDNDAYRMQGEKHLKKDISAEFG
jgi:hypothetical protein